MNILKKYQAFIFDLDNTLYNERDYLFPAYALIAEYFKKESGIDAVRMNDFLVSSFERSGRGNLFNKLADEFSLGKETVENALRVLRTINFKEKLKLYPEMADTIGLLNEANKKIFVLTNGNPQQQKNKVAHIDWQGLETSIRFYYANELEPKPSPLSVLNILSEFKLQNQEVLFIGDDEYDRECAENAGIDFMYTNEMKKRFDLGTL